MVYLLWTWEEATGHLTDEWRRLYRLPFWSLRQTKMQTLQYKIHHRTLPCRKYLKTLCVFSDDSCPFCSWPDTILHFLCDCPDTRAFWDKIVVWLQRFANLDISSLSAREVILGILPPAADVYRINFLNIVHEILYPTSKTISQGKTLPSGRDSYPRSISAL